jgi:serine phosphatase RsbU (regulator of sigma subunit)
MKVRPMTRVLVAFIPVDLMFKALITTSLLGFLGVENAHERGIVIQLVALLSLPGIAAWVSALWMILRPIQRWAAADGEERVGLLVRAGEAAYRAPRHFAIAWAIHWLAIFTATPLLLRAGIPAPISTPGVEGGAVFFSATMIGGALSLGYTLIEWLLQPVTGAISLEARSHHVAIRARIFSLRTRLILLALCLAMTPSTWFSSFAYVDSVRSSLSVAEVQARLALANGTGMRVHSEGGRIVPDDEGARAMLSPRLAERLERAARENAEGTIVERELVVAYRSRPFVAALVVPEPHMVDVAFRMIAIQMVAAAVWAPLCAAFLGATLSGALSRIADAIREISRRKSAVDVPRVPVFQRDEIGTLVDNANEMIDDLEATARSLEKANAELEAKRLIEQEIAIGARIQAALLPRDVEIRRLEVAAAMRPAAQVGGDYYDLLPTAGGGFIGIGDVAGHGLQSGLVMLMVQSTLAALVASHPNGSPAEILRIANGILYDNIRKRLEQHEHVTLSLLRYSVDGEVVFAGAHEEILVLRASSGKVERIHTPGTWLGMVDDVGAVMVDRKLRLEVGDLLVLYSDGLTEACDGSGTLFGIDRLVAALERHRKASPREIRDRVLEEVAAHQTSREDDETLLVIRYA